MSLKDFRRKVKNFLFYKEKRFNMLNVVGIYNNMTDEIFLKKSFKIVMGKELDLDNPKTYNEKLQWLKLYNRNTLYTQLVDKYEARKYVIDKIGEEYLIPNLGVWDKFDDINFDKLPNQFVLKCNHNSGGLVICKNKLELNIPAIRQKFNKFLSRNYFWSSREWPYKNVKPRIIAEEYVVDESGYELKEYKFMCFNGTPKLMYVVSGNNKVIKDKIETCTFYDMNFDKIEMQQVVSNNSVVLKNKELLNKMKHLAAILSCNIPHVRVDFYMVEDRIYFSEMTFYNWSGLRKFEPEEWDNILGSWIELPPKQIS